METLNTSCYAICGYEQICYDRKATIKGMIREERYGSVHPVKQAPGIRI